MVTVLQVVAFGGGLSTDWPTGTLSKNKASMGVVVLAHSTFTAGNVTLEANQVARGAIYGGCSR
jgi:hypothetical protein